MNKPDLKAEAVRIFELVEHQSQTLAASLQADTGGFRGMLELSERFGACRPELLPPKWGAQTEKLRRVYNTMQDLIETLKSDL